MSTQQKSMIWMLIPVMFSFFTMGFVDLVGIATNYVKVWSASQRIMLKRTSNYQIPWRICCHPWYSSGF